MRFILGLISLIASIALAVCIQIFANFDILHFGVLMIVPAGAIAIGYISTTGYFKGMEKSNVYLTPLRMVFAIIIAIISMISIEYIVYLFTSVDPETYNTIYSLDKGAHISEFEVEGYGQMTFLNFKRYMIESTPMSFSLKHKEIFSVTSVTGLYILNSIDYLGIIIGAWLCGMKLKDKSYCHQCNTYRQILPIFNLPKEQGEVFIHELESVLSTEDDIKISSFLNQYSYNQSVSKQEHYLCNVAYCLNCPTAILSIELYEYNSKKAVVKNESFEYEKEIYKSYINYVFKNLEMKNNKKAIV
ncbi:hypothetical protein [Tepidibacter hydrothermalis]|uniref:Uncharacterized protein n=1 Tax=Tepidibacter hydrothermalis TaxID=3036126 RepID=A0ABY8E7E8_9FIRM|nr:hypothetical protein [Tepidibacter hydrothermalis]WFD08826.1 hypothetical protein P4S50_10505 [Tepidibacter hydrothermalis]